MRNRTVPGKYALGRWRNLEATEAQQELEQQVMATQHLQVVRCHYRAGSDFAPHTHPQEQITIVESGVLEFLLDGEAVRIGDGEMISIFAGVSHGSRVVGDQSVQALNLFHTPGNGLRGEENGTGV